jgi:hypothetical protein|tara:strand:+ start:281 stop:526 length:246 start_codon:yes stop_codon:yes gene_type:complete
MYIISHEKNIKREELENDIENTKERRKREKKMTFKRKLMYTNKSPRRIDRKAGARNKKITKPFYLNPCYLGEIEKQKKTQR